MNYLAHLFLAENTPASLLGNLLADFVKGAEVNRLPSAVQQGIQLHRQVDAFTDRHPVVQRSIRRISERWGWYSGIVIDMWYDHLLSRDWDRYSTEPLREFIDRVYVALKTQLPILNDECRTGLSRLIQTDRLANYARINDMRIAFQHISLRIMQRIPQRVVRLQDSIQDLQANEEALRQDFHEFFPQLIQFVFPKSS